MNSILRTLIAVTAIYLNQDPGAALWLSKGTLEDTYREGKTHLGALLSLRFEDLEDKKGGCPHRLAQYLLLSQLRRWDSDPVGGVEAGEEGGHSWESCWLEAMEVICQPSFLRPHPSGKDLWLYSHSCNVFKHITKLERFWTLFCLDCYLQTCEESTAGTFLVLSWVPWVRMYFLWCWVRFWRWPRTSGVQLPSSARCGGGDVWVKLGYLASRIECWWHDCETCQE